MKAEIDLIPIGTPLEENRELERQSSYSGLFSVVRIAAMLTTCGDYLKENEHVHMFCSVV